MSWNRGAEEIFGYRADEMIGRSFLPLVPHERRNELDQLLMRLQASEPVESIETERISKSGKRIQVSLALTLTRDAQGRPNGIAGIARDDTYRKAAEAERARLAQELMHASRQKDEFITLLAHELRNPMAAVAAAIEVLERKRAITVTGEKALGILRRQTIQLGKLVDEMLDVSRIARQKIELHRHPIDLAALVAEVVEDQRTIANKRQLGLSLACGGRPWVSGDRIRLN